MVPILVVGPGFKTWFFMFTDKLILIVLTLLNHGSEKLLLVVFGAF